MDCGYLAEMISAACGLPVYVFADNVCVNMIEPTEFRPILAGFHLEALRKSEFGIGFFMDDNMLCSGYLRVKDNGTELVIGPMLQCETNETNMRMILQHIDEPVSRYEELMAYFETLPGYSLRRFLQMLCILDWFVNDEKVELSTLLINAQTDTDFLPDFANVFNGGSLHNSILMEQEVLSLVEHGQLNRVIEYTSKMNSAIEGQMARNALRHQKNLLIVTATLVSRAAVRGGMSYEKACTLLESYIQQAELLNHISDIILLNAKMLFDFTDNVEKARTGCYESDLAITVRRFIIEHMDEPITTEEISDSLGINRTVLFQRFKKETGITLGRFITEIKTEEAKRLLSETSKSIVEIAYLLGYSSQSHFQRVFHKEVRMTPRHYRLQHLGRDK